MSVSFAMALYFCVWLLFFVSLKVYVQSARPVAVRRRITPRFLRKF